MKRTFDEIKRMLEEKELLFDATQVGQEFEIDAIANRGLESEPHYKLVILRPGVVYTDNDLLGRVSFLAPLCTLDRKASKILAERQLGTAPFQLFTVQECNLDVAEAAIREFLSEKPVEREKPAKSNVTVADIEALPEDEIANTYTVLGECPYCGKKLNSHWCCGIWYDPCDCEVGKAAHAHNERRDEKRKAELAALKTVADIKAFPKNKWIPLLSEDGGHCAFCGKPLGTKDIHTRHCDDHHRYEQQNCYCEMAQAAREHNEHVYE